MYDMPHPEWDVATSFFFNQIIGKNFTIDTLMLIFATNNALKSGILIAVLIGLWEFGRVKKILAARKRVIAVFFAIFLSLAAIEVMNAYINSPRPLATYKKQMNKPTRVKKTHDLWNRRWKHTGHNSFPSDTTGFLAVIPISLFLWSRRLGLLTGTFVLLVGVLPRLSLGLHYISDMSVAILISLLAVFLVEKIKLFDFLEEKLVKFSDHFPFIFGGLGFFVALVAAEKFDLLLDVIKWIGVIF